jgi:hypothetical protein
MQLLVKEKKALIREKKILKKLQRKKYIRIMMN